MKISNNAITLSNGRNYSKYQNLQADSVMMNAAGMDSLQGGNEGIAVSISKESQELLKKMQMNQDESHKNIDHSKKHPSETANKTEDVVAMEDVVYEETEQTAKVVQQILDIIENAGQNNRFLTNKDLIKKVNYGTVLDPDSGLSITMNGSAGRFHSTKSVTVLDLRGEAVASEGTTWFRQSDKSSYLLEKGSTLFTTTGIAHTRDGKEIKFTTELEMSKRFEENILGSQDVQAMVTDALAIQLDHEKTEIMDQHIYLDLDKDNQVKATAKDVYKEMKDLENRKPDVNADNAKQRNVIAIDRAKKDAFVDIQAAHTGMNPLQKADKQTKMNAVYAAQKKSANRDNIIFLNQNMRAAELQHVNYVI